MTDQAPATVDNGPSDDDLERLSAELRAAADGVAGAQSRVADVEEELKAKSAWRMAVDRSTIAILVVVTYAVAVAAIFYNAAPASPSLCGGDGEPACADAMARWSTQIAVLTEVLSTAVVPVVTLVLGFYFGAEKSKS